MSMTTFHVDESTEPAVRPVQLGDFLELVKPRISAMVLVTVALSMFVASGGKPDLVILLHTLLGTALVAGSSGAVNQWLERHTDAQMDRTADRPLPSGRLAAAEVVSFGLATLIVGTTYLALTVGWQATFWAVTTWVIYVCIYTPLKSITSWNTTVGAISGALPILIGWSAVSSTLSWSIIAMLTVLFFWQFSHFIAIAWIYRRQYARAGLQMVTTTDPSGRRPGIYSLIGVFLLLAASLLPLMTEFSIIYAAIAIGLGLYQGAAAWTFHKELSDLAARQLLIASIIYLPLALGLIAVQTAL